MADRLERLMRDLTAHETPPPVKRPANLRGTPWAAPQTRPDRDRRLPYRDETGERAVGNLTRKKKKR